MDSLMPPRSAEVIAVGSELLGSTRTDTNSLFLSERLSELGIDLRIKSVVGDNRDDLAAVLRQALARTDLVVLTGGLGPTDDDLTRDVVSELLELPMTIDESIVAKIRARFERRNLSMPDVNLRQAEVPRGAIVLDNPNGTAPGLFIEHEGKIVVLLPGPPRELQPMFDAVCVGPLRARAGAERSYRTSLYITGRGESHVEQKVQPIYSKWRDRTPPIATTILAAMGQIELHLSVRDTDEARARATLEQAKEELLTVIADDVYSTDGRSMEQVVGHLLEQHTYTIAAAALPDCRAGIVYRRAVQVAPHGCAGKLHLRASRRHRVCLRRQDVTARCAEGDDRNERRGQRTGRRGDGGRDPRAHRCGCRRRHHRHRR